MSAVATAVPIAFEDVRVRLGGREVLRGVDLELRAGELLGLLGPNGAGKSTLLRAATGVLPLAGGSIRVEGLALEGYSQRQLARRVAVVQQLPEAPAEMSVAELVVLGRTPYLGMLARESPRDLEIAQAAMARAGCDALADRALGTLSGGQRRRAFIARALAQEPAILLLDEPTANLDPNAQAELCLLLRGLVDEGVAVMVVIHDLTLAAAFCDRVALLDGGRVAAAGPPREVLTQERLRAMYGPLISVIAHPETGLPVLAPGTVNSARAASSTGG